MTNSPCVKELQIVPHLSYPPPHPIIETKHSPVLISRVVYASTSAPEHTGESSSVDVLPSMSTAITRAFRLSALGYVVVPLTTPLVDLFGAVTDVMLVALAHPARPSPGIRGRGATAAAVSSLTRETAPYRCRRFHGRPVIRLAFYCRDKIHCGRGDSYPRR